MGVGFESGLILGETNVHPREALYTLIMCSKNVGALFRVEELDLEHGSQTWVT